MFLSECREFPLAYCLAGKKNLMTARVLMLLKSHSSLTCFQACFLPGQAKDLSAPWYYLPINIKKHPRRLEFSTTTMCVYVYIYVGRMKIICCRKEYFNNYE